MPTNDEPLYLSLSQATLAPINSLFKTQIHAARSFLGMLLEVGYEKPPGGTATIDETRTPRVMRFKHGETEVEVPALALVPIAPLGVESAAYSFELTVEELGPHQQSTVGTRATRKEEPEAKSEPRPWYLVGEPVSFRGRLGAHRNDSRESRESTVRLEVKVGQLKTPAALDRLLTSLTESARQLEPSPDAKGGRP